MALTSASSLGLDPSEAFRQVWRVIKATAGIADRALLSGVAHSYQVPAWPAWVVLADPPSIIAE